MLPRSQQEVDHLADRRHRVGVLREAHRPADDDALGCSDALGERVRRRRGRIRWRVSKCSQSNVRASSAKSSKPFVYCSMNSVSRASIAGGDEQVVDGLEEREVAVDPDREVVVGESRARSEQPAQPLRVLEPDQAGFGQRVDGDDRRARPLRLLERGQHARVIGARVLPDHHDQVGGDEIGDVHRALADADRLGQRHPARLVAHVRTVRQVVGPEATGRATGRGTRLRCSCDRTCRTPRRPARAAPAAPRRSARTLPYHEIGS